MIIEEEVLETFKKLKLVYGSSLRSRHLWQEWSIISSQPWRQWESGQNERRIRQLRHWLETPHTPWLLSHLVKLQLQLDIASQMEGVSRSGLVWRHFPWPLLPTPPPVISLRAVDVVVQWHWTWIKISSWSGVTSPCHHSPSFTSFIRYQSPWHNPSFHLRSCKKLSQLFMIGLILPNGFLLI